MLCWSLVRILKLRPLWVCAGVVITIVSVFLADALIAKAKLVPLVPMVVGIASLSIILLFDKRNEENREWALSSWGFAKQILPLSLIHIFLCLVIFPKYFVIRLYQAALLGQAILQSVCFRSIVLPPAHIFTQAFNLSLIHI